MNEATRTVIRSSDIKAVHEKEDESKKKRKRRGQLSKLFRLSTIEPRKLMESNSAIFISIPSMWFREWNEPTEVFASLFVEEDSKCVRFIVSPSIDEKKNDRFEKLGLKKICNTHFMEIGKGNRNLKKFINSCEYVALKKHDEYAEVIIPKTPKDKKKVVSLAKLYNTAPV